MSIFEKLTRCPLANAVWAFALLLLLITVPSLVGRLQQSSSGTIINTVTRDDPRRTTYYTLQNIDGATQTLIAGATDASLPRDLPKGTVIEKKKWQIGYSLDSVYRTGFPLGSYVGGVLGAVVLVAYGFRLWHQHRVS